MQGRAIDFNGCFKLTLARGREQGEITHYKYFKLNFIQDFNDFFEPQLLLTTLDCDTQGLYSLVALDCSVPLLTKHIKQYGIDSSKKYNILDGMAGVGGMSIAMMMCFQNSRVTSNELDDNRFADLKQNVHRCREAVGGRAIADMTLKNMDVMALIFDKAGFDIIFLDPEWGGPCYHDQAQCRLDINKLSIENCVQSLFSMRTPPRHVIVSIPRNFSTMQEQAIREIAGLRVHRISTHSSEHRKHTWNTLLISLNL